MKLYHHPLSGHSHRACLFVSLLGLPHELVEVDLKAGAHKTPGFLALNQPNDPLDQGSGFARSRPGFEQQCLPAEVGRLLL